MFPESVGFKGLAVETGETVGSTDPDVAAPVFHDEVAGIIRQSGRCALDGAFMLGFGGRTAFCFPGEGCFLWEVLWEGWYFVFFLIALTV